MLVSNPHPRHRLPWVAVAAALLLLLAAPAWAQPSLSTDFQGPLFPVPLDSGAILLATPGPGPLPPPATVIPSPALGIVGGIVGFPELDALSYGRDTILRITSAGSWGSSYRMLLSTDEFANGDPANPFFPDLFSEGSLGTLEASADLEITSIFPGLPVPPLPPGPPAYGNTSGLDGNGIFPFGGPGVGLIEPNPPTPGGFPDPGDTIDAADFRAPMPRIYFSLDASYVDPLEGFPVNSATAAANGVLPGDVLISGGGGAFAVWAPAPLLGLGPADDLDALILWENGDGVFVPSVVPFDWQFGGGTDMLLFSVRRASPLIGTPDAFFGVPIEEGDILTTPPGGPGTPP
ncbi:MAG: hypothetical protein MI919_15680, partial [Holophagales bacterium]|nr:hypothetical protein [Holophagales bacterium]